MTKKDKIFMIVITVLTLVFGYDAKAESNDVYYQNDHYVKFTKEEYDTISEFYYEGYQDYMNQEDYEEFINSGIVGGEIKTVITYDNSSVTRASVSHTTANKSLKVTYSCPSTTCTMSAVATWINSPKVRSYDLIGAYSSTKDSLKMLGADVTGGVSFEDYVEKRVESYGVSSTLKLPSSGDSVRVSATITAKKGSTVYVSYQHAKKSISLANSRKYSFNVGGYGNVFLFDSSVSSYYDAMGGVKVSL